MKAFYPALKVLAAGAAGLIAMEAVRRTTMPLIKDKPRNPLSVFANEQSMSLIGLHHQPAESATDALGRIAYEKLTGTSPDATTKRTLSWAIHIGYGVLATALFVAVRRHPRALRDGFLYGSGLWLFGDELAVPLLGLADKPSAYHPSRHAQSFAQHIGFGLATAATARALEVVS